MKRLAPQLTLRTLVRAVLPLFVLAALMPAAATAQDPGTGGYAGTGPAEVSGTEPAPASGTKAELTEGSSNPAPVEQVTAPSTSELPFTGLQIAAMIAAGFALLGLGMALRRISGPALPGT